MDLLGQRFFDNYPETPQNDSTMLDVPDDFPTQQVLSKKRNGEHELLSPFVRNLLAKHAHKKKNNEAGSSSDGASRALRADSPVSVRL